MSEFHYRTNPFVSHVELQVLDLERSLAFYQRIIGFKVLRRDERRADLTADGKRVLLSIAQPEDVIPKQPRKTGLYHFALLLPTRADLARIVRQFIENRYPLQGASDHAVSEALYLGDPDGNGIEIYADRPSEAWRWSLNEVRMVTEPLDFESLLAEEEGSGWQGLPEQTVMGHIHLQAAELKDIEAFYTQALGFDVVAHYGNQALFISTGGYHHHIGLNTWSSAGASAPAPNSVGLRSYTIQYGSEEKLKETVERLRSLGYEAREEAEAFTATDPSGNRIRLIA